MTLPGVRGLDDALNARGLVLIETIHQDDEIGRGLYKVRAQALGLHYALKLVVLGAASRLNLEREVAPINRLPFGLAPHCHAQWVAGGCGYVLMDWIDGPSLERLFAEPPEEPLEVARRLRAMALLARRLHDIHRARIVHRDVKPANVIVREVNRNIAEVYLIDFGLSAQDRRGEEGTPGYRAPEQVLDRHMNITVATDIFGLGQTGWALMSGRPRTLEPVAALDGWTASPRHFVSRLVPEEVLRELDRATAFRPDARHRDAGAFAFAMELACKRVGGSR